MRLRIITAAVAAAWLLATPAHAFYRFLDLGLTADDIQMMENAARVEMDGQPEGTRLHWENPASGAEGYVDLIRLYENRGYPCRELTHWVRTPTRGTTNFNSKICQLPDGTWQFDD